MSDSEEDKNRRQRLFDLYELFDKAVDDRDGEKCKRYREQIIDNDGDFNFSDRVGNDEDEKFLIDVFNGCGCKHNWSKSDNKSKCHDCKRMYCCDKLQECLVCGRDKCMLCNVFSYLGTNDNDCICKECIIRVMNGRCKMLLDKVEGYKEIKRENERLKEEIRYRPGGEGYKEVKEHFESCVRNEK